LGNNAQNRCKSYSTQSNPASLFENQDCGDEVKGCHEGTCFAAPVAQNEKSSKEAIANQTQEEAEASNPASLLVENSVSAGEVKTIQNSKLSISLLQSVGA
jgi:hypothetical protein